jgi:hypothetical protein
MQGNNPDRRSAHKLALSQSFTGVNITIIIIRLKPTNPFMGIQQNESVLYANQSNELFHF